MTYYEEFGVAADASPDEIRQAHRNLARLLHPDHIQDDALRALAECQMKRLNSIYGVLMDPSRRRMYDLQSLPALPGVAPAPALPAADKLTWKGASPWLFALAGAVSAGAAFTMMAPSNGRVVYVERPAAVAAVKQPGGPAKERPARSATESDTGEVRRLADEARELRRALHQAMAQRDRISSRPQAQLPDSANDGAPEAATAVPAHREADTEQNDPRLLVRPRLGGTWIYAAGANPAPQDEQYPADYIELVLDEREGHLRGRYRARYRVSDRALSPDVEFFFEGDAATAAKYPWRGNGGSRGELQLRLVSDNTLSVGWFTSQLGRVPSLGSGTALLVRRQDQQP